MQFDEYQICFLSFSYLSLVFIYAFILFLSVAHTTQLHNHAGTIPVPIHLLLLVINGIHYLHNAHIA